MVNKVKHTVESDFEKNIHGLENLIVKVNLHVQKLRKNCNQ